MKKLSIVLLAIVLTGLLAIAGFYGALVLFLSGTWPFPALETKTTIHQLSNGGQIIVMSVEDRGFGSDGFGNTAYYQEFHSAPLEVIGGWQGYETSASSFVIADMVIMVNPNKRALHVRLADESWKFFQFSFPDSGSEFPLSYYSVMTGLEEGDVKRIMNENVPGISPSAYITSFSPDSRELLIHYLASTEKQLYIRMQLSENGQSLKLVEIHPKVD